MSHRTILRRLAPALACAMALVAPAAVPAEVTPEVRAKAAPVFAALDKIASRAETAGEPGSRRLTFTEAELNAYAACRVEAEGGPYVKSLELKLLGGDKIEGRVRVDLGQPQASGLVPQKQELLFAGRFETQDGRIRITMDKLFLGAQEISPSFIDVVIAVASRLQGVEARSLKDWYDLPDGVLRLESRSGQIVIVY
jgi:hypothetical protein